MKKKIASIILTSIATIFCFFSIIGYIALISTIKETDTGGEAIGLIVVIVTVGPIYFLGTFISSIISLITLPISIKGIKENKENKKYVSHIICILLSSLYIIWLVVSIIMLKFINN